MQSGSISKSFKLLEKVPLDTEIPKFAILGQPNVGKSSLVNALLELLPKVLDQVTDQIVMDVGSTKEHLLNAMKDHPNRKQFVATHPMAGTEFSGPEAAIPNLFAGKVTVLCDIEDSSSGAKVIIEELYRSLGMSIIYLNAKDHDVHSAYVSHISHISSFALALTVLEKERDEDRIFEFNEGLRPENDQRGLSSGININSNPFANKNRDSLQVEYLKVLNKIHRIKIDSTDYKTSFVISKSRTGQLGFETYIDLKDIARGKHTVQVTQDRIRKNDTIKSLKAKIPFWYYPN